MCIHVDDPLPAKATESLPEGDIQQAGDAQAVANEQNQIGSETYPLAQENSLTADAFSAAQEKHINPPPVKMSEGVKAVPAVKSGGCW